MAGFTNTKSGYLTGQYKRQKIHHQLTNSSTPQLFNSCQEFEKETRSLKPTTAMETSHHQQQNPTPNERVHVLQDQVGNLPQITLTDTEPILASDPPQRSWNNAQCRQWIAAVFMDRSPKQMDEAKFWASRFWGDGVDMFLYGPVRWEGIVCSRQIGFTIYCIIDGVKEREKAVAQELAMRGSDW